MSDSSNLLMVEARSYELDAYGHVNIAVYVNWLEHGRLCFLRDRGLTYTSIPERFGVHVMVIRQEIEYRAQIRLGDRLTVSTTVERLGRTSFTFDHAVRLDDGRDAATARVVMVCVGPDERATPIPDGLRDLLGGPPSGA